MWMGKVELFFLILTIIVLSSSFFLRFSKFLILGWGEFSQFCGIIFLFIKISFSQKLLKKEKKKKEKEKK